MNAQRIHATSTRQRVFNLIQKVSTLTAIALLLFVPALISESRTAAHSAQQEEQTLELNRIIQLTLNGSEKHHYKLDMEAGQYARVSVLPQKGELKVELFAPDGSKALEVSGENGTPEGAVVSIIAERTGVYRLTVSLKDSKLDGIVYSATVKEKREVTQTDRDRTQAESLFADAEILRQSKKMEELQEAIKKYEESLLFWRNAGDKRGEADAACMQGYVYFLMADYEKALDAYGIALGLSREAHSARIEADILISVGVLFRLRGNYHKALEHYLKALPLVKSIGYRRGESTILNNIASFYRVLGQPQESMKYRYEALAIRREEKDRIGEARMLAGIALAYSEMKQYGEAVDYYEKALLILRTPEARDSRLLAITLGNLGYAYKDSGNPDLALKLHFEALWLHKQAGDTRSVASTNNYIGEDYEAKSEFELAGEHRALALALSREIKDASLELQVLYGLAKHEHSRGNLQQALTYIKNTVTVFESLRVNLPSPDLRASYLASRRGYYDLYIDLLLKIGKQQSEENYSAEALEVSERAHARALLDILAEVRTDLREGVDPALIERERGLQKQKDDKTSELTRLLLSKKPEDSKQSEGVEKTLAQFKLQLDQVKEQIKKSSPKYAVLTQPQPLSLKEVQQKVLDADTLLLEYMLGEDRSYLFVVTRNKHQTFILPKRAEIEKVATRFIRWFSRKEKFEDDSDFATRVQSFDRFTAECLPTAAKLSQMLLGPVADQLKQKKLLLVNDGILHYIPYSALPEPKSADESVGDKQGRVSKHNKAPQNAANRRADATGKSQPDYNPLVLNHEIASVPSASTLHVIRQETANRPLASKAIAVFADPVFEPTDERVTSVNPGSASQYLALRSAGLQESQAQRAAREVRSSDSEDLFKRLLYTRREAQNIGRLLPSSQSRIVLDFGANRADVASNDFSQYRIVHFATHGYLIEQYPGLSGIVLSLVDGKGKSTDGYLRLGDIFNLKLPVELVVLSACQTGLGKIVEGEGVMGMTRGLMYAGAKRVIVSLWNVSDLGTSRLMSKFYAEALPPKAISPAAALRNAQIGMWQQKQWRSPYFWACFVMQGEPR